MRSPTAFICLCLAVLARAISASASAETAMICSPTDPTDCYPQIFEPTKDFQVIKEGQDIPPGLHVRMDIYTGLKEARLNVPTEGEEGVIDALEDIPTEQAMVVVEQPEVVEERPAMRDQVPIQPPVYESAGKIPPPPSSDDDFVTFYKAILAIRMEAGAFDSALDSLSELSHDIYFGLEISKDGPIIEKLVCLTLGSGSEKIPAKENSRDHKAASILAAALQNNPTAVKEVSNFWRMVMYPSCPDATDFKAKPNFVSILRSRLGRERNPHTLKVKLAAISGLLKEPLMRDEFLEKGGMELLLAIFLKKGDEFDFVRKRVAELVTDTFLDEGMGAELGVWPKMPVSEAKVCKSKERMLEGGCWEHHVQDFLAQDPEVTWAQTFLDTLRAQREKYGASLKDREL